MRCVAISDTHCNLRKMKIPDGDLLIHAGDWTNYGRPHELQGELDYFYSLPHARKLWIAGNHDFVLENERPTNVPENVHYLQDEGVEIEGHYFYGSPWVPAYGGWAFNMEEWEMEKVFSVIPDQTEVLITHCPPKTIRDAIVERYPSGWEDTLNIGSRALLDKIKTLTKLRYQIHGHVHEQYGSSVINGVTYINAASHYGINPPIEFDL